MLLRPSLGECHAIVWSQSIRPLAAVTGSKTVAADMLCRLSVSCDRFWLIGKRFSQRPHSISLTVGDRRTDTLRSKAHLTCRRNFCATIVRLKLRAHNPRVLSAERRGFELRHSLGRQQLSFQRIVVGPGGREPWACRPRTQSTTVWVYTGMRRVFRARSCYRAQRMLTVRLSD